MFIRLLSVFKVVFLNVIFLKKIKIGFAKLFPGAKIKISSNSSMSIKKGFIMQSNTNLAAVDGGIIDIGCNVFINYNSIIVARDKVNIGNNCAIGPNVCIYDHDHKFDKNGKNKGFNTSEVVIGSNVWIGASAIILRGTVIGDNSVIGAGCIVSGVIPPNSLVTNSRELNIEKLK